MAWDIIKLPDPPCIPGLVGCDESSMDSSGYLDQPIILPSTSIGASSGVNSSSSSSSSSGAAGTLSSSNGYSWNSRISRGREAIAQYVLTAKNKGTEFLQGVKIWHGPLPFGATFDASRSSSGCVQDGTSVVCTADLAAGATKEFTLSYQVSSSVSCAIARVLQKATIAARQLTGNASDQVSVSVQCSMLASDAPATVAGAGDGSASSQATIGGATSASMEGDGAYEQSIQTGTKCIPGYRGKGGCPEAPRTGAVTALFTAQVTDSNMLKPYIHPREISPFPSLSILMISAIVIVAFALRLRRMLIQN